MVASPPRLDSAPPLSLSDDGEHAELRDLVGPEAKTIPTRHFVVAYDTPIDTVRRLTARLEATYLSVERICNFNGIGFDPPEAPLEILLFDRPEEFHDYGAALGVEARGLIGFYHAASNRSAFFNILNHPGLDEYRRGIERLEERLAELNGRKLTKTERAEKRQVLKQLHFQRNRRDRFVEKLNRTTVQHEVVHHVLFEAGVHVKGARTPAWLVEGLACLFETPPSRKGAGIGVTNQMRLADFRTACGEKRDPPNKRPIRMKPEDLQMAYDQDRFIPLRRFIALHDLSKGSHASSAAYRYAQAWGLAFYLQRTHREELAQFIALTAHRAPQERWTSEQEIAQFEDVFGPVDDRFERRWASFIFKLPVIPETPLGRSPP